MRSLLDESDNQMVRMNTSNNDDYDDNMSSGDVIIKRAASSQFRSETDDD